jgi:DNA-binding LacI/PurR family transcriptional regulator
VNHKPAAVPSPKVKDVARLAGVSETTAFRALRNDPRVIAATIDRVKQAAEQLKYRPNVFARSVFTRKSYSIGVVLPRIGGFWPGILSGIQDAANEKGYTVVLYSMETAPQSQEVAFTHRLIERMVDGVIIVPTLFLPDQREHLDELRDRHIPFVVIDRVLQGMKCNIVISDDERGMAEGVDYLIEQGHRRIAHLAGPQENSTAFFRLKGYERALRAHGIAVQPEYVVQIGTYDDDVLLAEGYRRGLELMRMKSRPTAITCVSDMCAPGLYRALDELGLRVPRDVSVLGYSNQELGRYLTVPLTTIHQPTYEMGQAAMELLLETMRSGEAQTQPRKIMLPTRIEMRASCGPCPAL